MLQKKVQRMKENNVYDIEIDGYKYIWNSQPTDWINSENYINEIGSIHTTQGFDLNYTGLIIGNELKYDDINHKLIIDRKNYYDTKGKADTSDKELLEYILHIYQTMCTRGIRGTYLYVCNPKLKAYLSKYIDTYHDDGCIYSVAEEEEEYKFDSMIAEDSEEYKYE